MHRTFIIVLLLMTLTFFQTLTICLANSGSMAVNNIPPVIGTMITTDSITLEQGTTKTVWCNSTISDLNGATDIENISSIFWNPAETTESGSDDVRNHYTNSSCYFGGINNTHVTSNCLFKITEQAVPGTWTCKIYANDSANNSDNETSSVTVIGIGGGGGTGGAGGGFVPRRPEEPEEPEESEEPEELIPEQLLDVKLEIEENIIFDVSELTAIITFESFGTNPVPIDLIYIILDELEQEVYSETDNVIVYIEEVVIKKFEYLGLATSEQWGLGAGKYTLLLRIKYYTNITEEFEQDFEIKKEIEIGLIPWFEVGYITLGLLTLIVIAYIVKKIIRMIRRRRIARKNKEELMKQEQIGEENEI